MTSHDFWVALFWFSLAVVSYTHAGYPLLMFLLSRMSPRRRVPLEAKNTTSVTVVLAACNEEQRIGNRLTNLLTANCPPGQLQVVVVSDGSTDGTVEKVRALNERRVQLIVRPARAGKASCLNAALAAAAGDVIVFADARQRFEPDTIPNLVAHFQDPQVGAVSGELVIDAPASTVGRGVDAYWRFEKMLRHAEARWDSCIGCTGAVYAIRRKVFRPLPPDTILDDVVIPMQIATQGFRVVFEPSAIAHDPQPLEPNREQVRKRRTLAGNYQMLFRYPAWLLPWRNRLWWQLICHKYLRLAAPFFLVLMLVANLVALSHGFYWLPLAGQGLFYGLAILGLSNGQRKNPLFSVPAGFVFLNWMTLDGLRHYLRGTYQEGRWAEAHSQTKRSSNLPGKLSFSVTGYCGCEEEILTVRNRNRKTPQTRADMDWRYQGERTGRAPLVFWLRDENGGLLATGALIFRSYLVDGQERLFAVLGDISVEQPHRGKGLSKELYHRINAYIAAQDFDCAFVMPVKLAEKGLAATGWRTIGDLAPFVIVTNPIEKFTRILKLKPAAKVISFLARTFTRTLVAASLRANISMRETGEFDDEFETFWQRFPKAGRILRTRSRQILDWRFRQHPGARYSIHKFHAGGNFVGYIVSRVAVSTGICFIEDFLVAEPDLVQPCMASFLKQAFTDDRIRTVRIILINPSSYVPMLKRLGFVKRSPVTAFQIYNPRVPLIADAAAWFIMAGDKDAL
jgi:cellulose synthase/poly-beta-1,6-N-acetylglucosamine synthase-like glycosyltransferase